MLLIAEPSISMGHRQTMAMLNNQRLHLSFCTEFSNIAGCESVLLLVQISRWVSLKPEVPKHGMIFTKNHQPIPVPTGVYHFPKPCSVGSIFIFGEKSLLTNPLIASISTVGEMRSP